MKKTIITIEERPRLTHDFEIEGELTDEQYSEIYDKVEKSDHPGDIYSIVHSMGFKIISYDEDGCWEGSEFELLDSYEED